MYLTPQVLQLNCYFFIFFCILTIGDRPYLVSVAVRCLRDTAFVLSVIFSLYYFLFFSFHFISFFFTDKLEVLYLLMILFWLFLRVQTIEASWRKWRSSLQFMTTMSVYGKHLVRPFPRAVATTHCSLKNYWTSQYSIVHWTRFMIDIGIYTIYTSRSFYNQKSCRFSFRIIKK